jgi:hypothetical protein
MWTCAIRSGGMGIMLALAATARGQGGDNGDVPPPDEPRPAASAQSQMPSPPRLVGNQGQWVGSLPPSWTPTLPAGPAVAPAYQPVTYVAAAVAPPQPITHRAGPVARAVGNLGAWLERARWDHVHVPPPAVASTPPPLVGYHVQPYVSQPVQLQYVPAAAMPYPAPSAQR